MGPFLGPFTEAQGPKLMTSRSERIFAVTPLKIDMGVPLMAK